VSLGLAYRCLPTADELAHEASDLAARLAAGPVRSLGLSKQLLNATFESSLSVSLDREAQAQAMAAVSAEMAEGMAAFSEKRSPDFRAIR
jgi:2-(1,2-epoxy-1,2-dihydrophenyl)acetyl-CoA isomerase